MKLFISVLINREDSTIIGIYKTLTKAIEDTFIYLIKEEYLDFYNPEENEDKESISDEDFFNILKEETYNWEFDKIDIICKKYNSEYDNENFFLLIEEKYLT